MVATKESLKTLCFAQPAWSGQLPIKIQKQLKKGLWLYLLESFASITKIIQLHSDLMTHPTPHHLLLVLLLTAPPLTVAWCASDGAAVCAQIWTPIQGGN